MVATSKPTVFAERILAHFNLDHYFDFIGGSNLDGSRTKKSEVIAFVLSENNITDVSEVIMIGDRKHDMIGAEENGMDAIGVLYGYGNFEELSDAGAKYIVKEVEELVEIIIP
jgi:phosphoglycolate phosphatase